MTIRKFKKLSPRQLGEMARLFRALAEPSRLALLQSLRERPMTVNELTKSCGLLQANVSKQLGALYQANLVVRRRCGKSVCYALRDSIVSELCLRVCGKLLKDAKASVAAFRA
ncbi:MAG: metalloregulator ArsR/SmtB family transcription factor [bacterium]